MKKIFAGLLVIFSASFSHLSGQEQSESGTFQSQSEYDFIPGDKVLYFEDFSETSTGDFPSSWATNGSGEVKTISGITGKWLHLNGEDATYCMTMSIDFPENFIVEFDIIPDEEYTEGIVFTLYEETGNNILNEDLLPGKQGLDIVIKSNGWESRGYNNDSDSDWMEGKGHAAPVIKQQINHVIIWIQKQRVRIYHSGKKTLDMATNIYPGTKFNKIRFSGWDRYSWPYVSNIKITTSTSDNRNKLLTEGKYITYGICFDSGKDIVKSESLGTIKEIANIMKENPELRILIVGHTDSDGDEASNLDLSKRRSANVKKILVEQFSVDASRINTDGKGETEPVVSNNNSANKAKNRRVEIIKQ